MEALVRIHLSNGNTFRLRVRGGSMFPLIRSGDILKVRAAGDYSVGDVLLYARGGEWVAHRVLGAEKREGRTRLITRGDALPVPDPPVSIESVLGRVDAIERGRRHLRLDGLRGRAFRALAMKGFPWHRVLPGARAARDRVASGLARIAGAAFPDTGKYAGAEERTRVEAQVVRHTHHDEAGAIPGSAGPGRIGKRLERRAR